VEYGLTGVMARSTGLKRDLRLDKMETYANYYYLNFRSYVGQNGDSYDRFLIRMNEMTESLNIINQVVNKLTKHKKQPQSSKKVSNINPHFLLKYLYPKS
jgi:NADH:ubiquinone oxidoreductase subunit D